jgi:hypothetical protein
MSYAMSEYELRFGRYDAKSGESRLSDVQFTQAEDIRGAVRIAEAILTGLKTDLERQYRIISITERGSRGIDCRGGGISMFETREEFSARVAAKQEQQ